jgi:hypothetical protein
MRAQAPGGAGDEGFFAVKREISHALAIECFLLEQHITHGKRLSFLSLKILQNIILKKFGELKMPVSKIEKIKSGIVMKTADVAKTGKNKGKYVCFPRGQNVFSVTFSSLEDAAKYLRSNPKSGIRMNPGFGKVVDDIYIDGIAR